LGGREQNKKRGGNDKKAVNLVESPASAARPLERGRMGRETVKSKGLMAEKNLRTLVGREQL